MNYILRPHGNDVMNKAPQFHDLVALLSILSHGALASHELDSWFLFHMQPPVSKDPEIGIETSKVIFLELGPGSHQIIRDLHNCASSQIKTCFRGRGNVTPLLSWQHQMELASIYLTFSVCFNLLS